MTARLVEFDAPQGFHRPWVTFSDDGEPGEGAVITATLAKGLAVTKFHLYVGPVDVDGVCSESVLVTFRDGRSLGNGSFEVPSAAIHALAMNLLELSLRGIDYASPDN